MYAPAFLLFFARPHAILRYFLLTVTQMLRLCMVTVRSWAGSLQALQNCFYCYSNVNKLERFNTI